ncbi:GAF domain-containing protein [Capnocytophaga sp. ARDL2]|uniref:GAF domain-containing protein n=1 Tax=Capnocytophaga sp. ARDL2 TaxID=3238809 RepID=UPI003556363F
MSSSIIISQRESKQAIYAELLPQLKALVEGENDLIANLANITAALKEVFNWWWVGFYIVKNKELVLGPFQGTIACTRIAFGKGVCGTAWKLQLPLLVPDVHAFKGHIACSSATVAEIVLPIFDDREKVVAVLDVDSDKVNELTQIDVEGLKQISLLISEIWKS